MEPTIKGTTRIMKQNKSRFLREFTLLFSSIFMLIEGGYFTLFSQQLLLPILCFIGSLIFHSAYWYSREKRLCEWHAIVLIGFHAFNSTLQIVNSPNDSIPILFSILLPLGMACIYPKRSMNWFLLPFAIVYFSVLFLPSLEPLRNGLTLQMCICIFILFLFVWASANFTIFLLDEAEASNQYVSKSGSAQNEKYNQILSNISYTLRTTLSNITIVINQLSEGPETEAKKYNTLVDILKSSEQALKDISSSILMDSTAHPPSISISHFSFNEFIIARVKSNLDDRKLKNSIRYSFDPSIPQLVDGDAEFLAQAIDRIMSEILLSDIRSGLPISISTLQLAASEQNAIMAKVEVICGDIVVNTPNIADPQETENSVANLWQTLKIHRASHGAAVSFTIVLQRSSVRTPSRNPIRTITTPEETPATATNASHALENAKVLLVDDNQINRRVMRLTLTGKVLQIDYAQNGQEAVDMVEFTRYDIVLMDIQMPVMDGLQATRIIRAKEALSGHHTPIIALTAYAQRGDRESCLQAGMDAYLCKPFENEVLFALMRTEIAKHLPND